MGPWAGRTNFGRGQVHGQWAILAVGDGVGICPDCEKIEARPAGMSVIYRTCQRKARL